MQKEVYLVVVSILEGRNFPRRPKHQLVVECKFDGELLATDPVNHNDAPDFTTELAWELDKKALHQHRMQRTPIKLQCYAVNTANGMKENIGYVLLDLRMAQMKSQGPKWYSLLSSKYSRLKPAIKIGMLLEDDAPTHDGGFKAREAPPRQGKGVDKQTLGDLLSPQLNEDEGYFQIGPSDSCYEMFVLSVTIVFAGNLEQLIPSDKQLPSAGECFFYYSLLGHDVANDRFASLLRPEFVPERASVRVRSSVDVLRRFVNEQQDNIQIHLCTGEQSLGSATVSLRSLLKPGSREIEIKPIVIEGAFPLTPPTRVKEQMQSQILANVGVSISLRREEIPENKEKPLEEQMKSNVVSSKQHSTPLHDKVVTPETQMSRETDEEVSAETKDKQLSPAKLNFDLGTDDELESLMSDKPQNDNQEDVKPEYHHPTQLKNAATDAVSMGSSGGLTTTGSHPVIPAPARHYTFTVHLKSISNVDLPFACNGYIKYAYPFFGSAAPVYTNPPVLVKRQMEVTLPQAMCTFDFACTSSLLHSTLQSMPLVLELWHRDKESDDMLLGTTTAPLEVLLAQEQVKFVVTEDRREGYRQVHTSKLQVMDVKGKQKRVCDLNVALTLEDRGVARQQRVVVHASPKKEVPKLAPPTKTITVATQKPSTHALEPRETNEYKTALQLEMWKAEQEECFEKELKQREVAHMQALADEWQQRDREREGILAKKLAEYGKLETKLRKSLADVEGREKQLRTNEQELVRIRSDIQRQHEKIIAETKEASARMKEDCVHQVQLERNKIRSLEDDNSKLRARLQTADKKYAELDKQFQTFKVEHNSSPEVRLQSELQLAKLEKRELERKLESCSKSKLHYKQQWGRALKELARLKQREQDHAMLNLKRQQDELEEMRLKYFANEESNAHTRDHEHIQALRDEISKLKSNTARKEPSSIVINTTKPTHDVSMPTKPMVTSNGGNNHIDEHVARLIEERDTLLRTGVYEREDRIITELDRQIKDAISRKTLAT